MIVASIWSSFCLQLILRALLRYSGHWKLGTLRSWFSHTQHCLDTSFFPFCDHNKRVLKGGSTQVTHHTYTPMTTSQGLVQWWLLTHMCLRKKSSVASQIMSSCNAEVLQLLLPPFRMTLREQFFCASTGWHRKQTFASSSLLRHPFNPIISGKTSQALV